MAHTWIQPTAVARRALEQLKNNCIMGNLVFRGYEDEFKKNPNGWKVGSSVTIKAPVYFRVKTGATIDTVELREEDTTFTVSTRKHVAWPITSQQMTQDIDKFSKRFIEPAMQALANDIDYTLLGLYKGVPNQVGVPGTTPSQWRTIAEASAVLTDHAAPKDNRYCVLDPWATIELADQFKGLLHQGMVDKAISKGAFGNLAGFQMYESQNVNSHTCGAAAGATDILVDGAVSEGATTITIDQNGSYTKDVHQGDIFTVATVYGVNPISGQSTGRLRQFVVEADSSTTGNDDAVSCTPGVAPFQIYSASATEKTLPYQTVDALPADNDAVTVAGSSGLVHKVNLSFHQNALGLCMVPLEMPASVKWGAQESYDGYTVRVIRDYDIINDQEYIRFDVLFGVKVLNPFMACRIAG